VIVTLGGCTEHTAPGDAKLADASHATADARADAAIDASRADAPLG